MKQPATRPVLYVVTIGIIIALTSFSAYLYKQNVRYQKENHELIIQNDSIISANIELTKALERKKGNPKKNQSVSYNKPSEKR